MKLMGLILLYLASIMVFYAADYTLAEPNRGVVTGGYKHFENATYHACWREGRFTGWVYNLRPQWEPERRWLSKKFVMSVGMAVMLWIIVVGNYWIWRAE